MEHDDTRSPEVRAKLKEAAEANYGPSPEIHAKRLVRRLRSRHACPALQASALTWVEQGTPPLPVVLPPKSLARQIAVLDWATDLIKARRDGLAAQAMDVLKRGRSLPLRREAGAGTQRWAAPLDKVLAMSAMLGVDIAKPGA